MRVYFYICCQNEQFDQGLVFILKKMTASWNINAFLLSEKMSS